MKVSSEKPGPTATLTPVENLRPEAPSLSAVSDDYILSRSHSKSLPEFVTQMEVQEKDLFMGGALFPKDKIAFTQLTTLSTSAGNYRILNYALILNY